MRALARSLRLGLCAGILLAPAVADAQSLDDRLASAQDQAFVAEQKAARASAAADRAQRRLDANSPRTERAANAAAVALAEVEALETSIAAERTAALEEVTRIESQYQDDVQAHDDAVSSGVGFSLASLLLAMVAGFWPRFRQLAVVQRLAEGSWLRAIGIVGGIALGLTVVGGLLMDGPSAVRAFGAFVVLSALGGAAFVLVARHSIRVERKEEQSLVSRKRFPRWITVSLALLLLLLAAAGLGDAVSSEEPTEPVISAETRALAEAAEGDPLEPPTPELLAARQAAEPLVARANKLGTAQKQAQQALAQARQTLRASRRQLRRAQLTASRLSRRVAREAARQAALVPPPSSSGGSSAPSYSSCAGAPSNIPVPPGSALDGDGDGIGCEG